MGDMCRLLDTPVTGGNVSFHNQSQHNAIFPTPTIGMLGIIEDIDAVVGARYTTEGASVVMLGWQKEELGGSEFLKVVRGRVTGDAPSLDMDHEVNLQRMVLRAIREGLATAAHDCSEGGLLVALTEMCFGNYGASITIPFNHTAGNLFGEAQSRIIIEVHTDNLPAIQSMAHEDGIPCTVLGTVGGTQLVVDGLISEPIAELQTIHDQALPALLEENYVSI